MKQGGYLLRFSGFASAFWPSESLSAEKEKVMADGPTVVNTGGGGTTAVAIIVALVALVGLLFMFGVIDLSGGDGRDIDVKIDAPAVEAPAAPAAPAPTAPAPAAPANGG
jgi:hypothetical protein